MAVRAAASTPAAPSGGRQRQRDRDGDGRIVAVDARAYGGLGDTTAGGATASATGTGAGGTVHSYSQASLRPGQLITGAWADASAVVNGSSSTTTSAHIAGMPPADVTNQQAVAFVTGAPSTPA